MSQPRQPDPRSQPTGGGSQRVERADGGRGSDGDSGNFRRGDGGGGRGIGRDRP
jgi:hypothetical protein